MVYVVALLVSFMSRRLSGAGPPTWMQVVERRLEQAVEESSNFMTHFGLPEAGRPK